MNITEMIMNEMHCNQGRRADARDVKQHAARRQNITSHTYHGTSQLGGRAWMSHDIFGLERISNCTNSIQTAQARNEAAVMKV